MEWRAVPWRGASRGEACRGVGWGGAAWRAVCVGSACVCTCACACMWLGEALPWPCATVHGHAWPNMGVRGRVRQCVAGRGQAWAACVCSRRNAARAGTAVPKVSGMKRFEVTQRDALGLSGVNNPIVAASQLIGLTRSAVAGSGASFAVRPSASRRFIARDRSLSRLALCTRMWHDGVGR